MYKKYSEFSRVSGKNILIRYTISSNLEFDSPGLLRHTLLTDTIQGLRDSFSDNNISSFALFIEAEDMFGHEQFDHSYKNHFTINVCLTANTLFNITTRNKAFIKCLQNLPESVVDVQISLLRSSDKKVIRANKLSWFYCCLANIVNNLSIVHVNALETVFTYNSNYFKYQTHSIVFDGKKFSTLHKSRDAKLIQSMLEERSNMFSDYLKNKDSLK
jgi:hypothetical protein